MKKRIEDMAPGTRFRTSGNDDILVKLAGAVARGNGCFQAVSIKTGELGCVCGSGCSPQLALIEYEIVERTVA